MSLGYRHQCKNKKDLDSWLGTPQNTKINKKSERIGRSVMHWTVSFSFLFLHSLGLEWESGASEMFRTTDYPTTLEV